MRPRIAPPVEVPPRTSDGLRVTEATRPKRSTHSSLTFTKAESVEGRVNKMAEDVTLSEEVVAEVQDEPTELEVDGEGPDTESGAPLGDDTEVEAEVAEIEVDEAAAEIAVDKAAGAEDEDESDDVEKAAE
jgi:hypothetical protein